MLYAALQVPCYPLKYESRPPRKVQTLILHASESTSFIASYREEIWTTGRTKQVNYTSIIYGSSILENYTRIFWEREKKMQHQGA
jgi:hypothetical protein